MGNCCGMRKNKVENSLTFQKGPCSASATVITFTSDGNVDYAVHPSPGTLANFEEKIIRRLDSRSEEDILSTPHLTAFTFNHLRSATLNFHPNNCIGEGGFGEVYKGWIDEQTFGPAKSGQGMVVAVKKLKPECLQGHKEWLCEVNCLGQLHHPNLVKLVGYCLDGENRLLVYEYMPKGSLENHLFKSGARPLSWALRIKVATGAARGLSFLHDSEQQIIYRDLKASNILLDSEFNAKLSDFGLAKAGPTGDHSHVSTQILGTQGYAAPEYIATGRLTTKCDVYSFGVVLLELLTGRCALDKTKVGVEQNLVDWAKPYLGDRRKLFRIMDIRLEGQYSQRGAFMVALLASHCINEAKLRPPMSEVLTTLEELSSSKPGASPSQSDQFCLSSPMSASCTPSTDSISSTANMNAVVTKSPANKDSKESPLPSFLNSPHLASMRR